MSRTETLLDRAPHDVEGLPAWLLSLAPREAQRVCVGALASIAVDDGDPPDWRQFERILRALRAQWRRADGAEDEHAAMVAELAARAEGPKPRPVATPRDPSPPAALDPAQRRVLERAYALVPEVGDIAAVRWSFPDRTERRVLARAVRWAPGLAWMIEVEADGLEEPCIRRTGRCAAEISRLLKPSRAGTG